MSKPPRLHTWNSKPYLIQSKINPIYLFFFLNVFSRFPVSEMRFGILPFFYFIIKSKKSTDRRKVKKITIIRTHLMCHNVITGRNMQHSSKHFLSETKIQKITKLFILIRSPYLVNSVLPDITTEEFFTKAT